MTFELFAVRCQPAALALEDRLQRYVSSWREWDLAADTLWPLSCRRAFGSFPWELGRAL